MTENVHEWKVSDSRVFVFECGVCGLRMTPGAALSRLNATERLSAEDARQLRPILDGYFPDHPLTLRAEAYAAALEGE